MRTVLRRKNTPEKQESGSQKSDNAKSQPKSKANLNAGLPLYSTNQPLVSLNRKPMSGETADEPKSGTSVWIVAQPVEIVDGPRKDIKDIHLGVVDLVDKIYVYRIPSRSYTTANADPWSIATRELSKERGDSLDGMEIRITVGFRQRTFGTLPVVKYEKVQWNFG
jgi:hypothetical protein